MNSTQEEKEARAEAIYKEHADAYSTDEECDWGCDLCRIAAVFGWDTR